MTITDSSLNVQSNPAPVLDTSFAKIDWQAPWLCHLNQLTSISQTVERLSNSSHTNPQTSLSTALDSQTAVVADILNKASKQYSERQPPQTKPTPDNQAYPLHFVAQDALPIGEGYECFIATTGNIPTRNNLHDLFNGSIWLTFPKTKALLNYYHMIEIGNQIDEQGASASRGRVRDTITVFDENGAILVTSESSVGKALTEFDWQESLVAPRAKWDHPKQRNVEAKTVVYIFGHALLEQLIQPRKALCAHSVIIDVAPDFFVLSLSERMRYLDSMLAKHMSELLSQEGITPRALAPLPILGVPHFWAENDNPMFYQDTNVFRSGRRQKLYP